MALNQSSQGGVDEIGYRGGALGCCKDGNVPREVFCWKWMQRYLAMKTARLRITKRRGDRPTRPGSNHRHHRLVAVDLKPVGQGYLEAAQLGIDKIADNLMSAVA